VAAGSRRDVPFALQNVSRKPVSGQLAFDLPEGITIQPERPAFGGIAPGQVATVEVTFAAAENAPAGLQTLPYRFILQGPGGAETETPELPVKIAVGPVLSHVYPEGDRPYFQIDAPLFTARLDMFHGMPRYLADDGGNVRIENSPVFTFAGDGKPMLYEHTPHAFTWPGAAPARMTAHAFDRCRYQIRFGADRMTMSMDSGWTQFDRADFTVPGKWVAPGGAPRWGKIIAVDGAGKKVEVKPETDVNNVIAAELEFPGTDRNIAFAFTPPQAVTFKGTSIEFSIGSLTGDRWSVGFCRPGELDQWRKE
jgi:hypothetical protein